MGLISPAQVSDGTTVDANDVNAPINTIADEINGNLDADNLASNAVTTAKIADASVTNAKLSTTAGEPAGAWKDWTPTWTNLTIGNGTETYKYTQIGKTVHVYAEVIFGSTSSISGSVKSTLPVNPASGLQSNHPIGVLNCGEAGVATWYGVVWAGASNDIVLLALNVSTGNYLRLLNVATALPFTWGTGDTIRYMLTYEGA